MPTNYYHVSDGLDEIRDELPIFMEVIARTALWVHPNSFRSLPVWFPEHARGNLSYDADWITPRFNQNRKQEVKEANIQAGRALIGALGAKKTPNWTVCHIWGRDDPTFQERNVVVQDPRYYSCVANMVWLPTPLKGFTDSVPEVKSFLRVCAYYTYGWACQHEAVREDAARITAGEIPIGYPQSWPRRFGDRPPRTALFSDAVKTAVDRRKQTLRRVLAHTDYPNFPRQQVRDVLDFWEIRL